MADLIIQRNKVWYAKCTFLGVRMRDSLKTTDKDQAVERLFELMLLVREGTYQYHATKFNDLAKKFEENPPLRDARNKLGVLRNHLMPAFKDKTLGEIDFEAWAEEVALNRPRTTAIYFIGVAKSMGLPIPEWKDIPLRQAKRWNETQILSEEQVLDVILNHCTPKKYVPVSLIACYSTLRRGTILSLRKKDVDLNDGINVVAGRSVKTAVFIPMHKKLRDAFDLVKVVPMRPDDLWFPDINGDNIGTAVRRAFKKVGISWGTFHHLRHFGACHMLNNGVDIATVSKWLGHKDIATTMIYARVNRDTLKDSAKVFDTNLHKSA